MYALSRSYAVDSQISSAAATRISTGNITGWASRRTPPRSSASTSRTASRGTAYSDSTNRTRRAVTNTRCDVSEYERLDSVAAASRFSGLIRRGIERPARHSVPNAAFSMTSYSQYRRQAGIGGELSSVIRLFRLTRALRP